jgi:hypothetical protein
MAKETKQSDLVEVKPAVDGQQETSKSVAVNLLKSLGIGAAGSRAASLTGPVRVVCCFRGIRFTAQNGGKGKWVGFALADEQGHAVLVGDTAILSYAEQLVKSAVATPTLFTAGAVQALLSHGKSVLLSPCKLGE